MKAPSKLGSGTRATPYTCIRGREVPSASLCFLSRCRGLWYHHPTALSEPVAFTESVRTGTPSHPNHTPRRNEH